VRYAGLLAKAHEAGLVKLATRIEFHCEALVLASATATLAIFAQSKQCYLRLRLCLNRGGENAKPY
jgi:hypothetical protein